MGLTGTHAVSDPGHTADHNLLDAAILALQGTASGIPTPFVEPASVLGTTVPRFLVNSGSGVVNNGTLQLAAVYLPAGVTINNLHMWVGGQGTTGQTNAWMGLFNASRVMLARTQDKLVTALTPVTRTAFPISQTAAGAATSFTTTYAGLYYIGFVVAVTVQVPNLFAYNGGQGNYMHPEPPILYGTSNTGMSSPPAFPFTANALTAITGPVPILSVGA